MKTQNNKTETILMLGTLMRLKDEVENNKSFSMNNFLKSNNLSLKLGKILKDERFICLVGGTTRKPQYEWAVADPTAMTATKVLELMKKDMRGKHSKRKKEAVKTPKKKKATPSLVKEIEAPIEKDMVGHAETKLLWGLITIKSKINIQPV